MVFTKKDVEKILRENPSIKEITIPEVIKEFAKYSFPKTVENQNVEVEIKEKIKKVFIETVDGFEKPSARLYKHTVDKAENGAKTIYESVAVEEEK